MFWRKKRPLSDFAEEIRSHLEHQADDAQDRGAQREDAEASAQRAFGNTTLAKEDFYRQGRWMFLDRIWRDLQHAVRLFARKPGFSAVVVLTLALGIGANTAIFSVIDAVLLRPLPYKDPARLAMLWSEDSAHGLQEGRVSLLNFADWKARARTFEDLTFFNGQTFMLGSNDGPPERMRAARVPANFFPMLGVEPVLGRVFSAEEEKRGESLVVLSYGLWQKRFAGSPLALGSELILDKRQSRVIGVMPASFRYPFPDTQVWEPLTAHPYWETRDRKSLRSFSVWYALGRVKRGASLDQVQAEMSGIARQLAAEHVENRNLPEIRVVPLPQQTTGRVQLSLYVLFGAVFLMLLIACINVANLILARGSAREREFSMRRALGAGTGVLAAQLLTESLVLAAAGGALGLALSSAALQALIAYGPRGIPRLAEAHIDARVLAFTACVSIFSAVMSGLWPAMRTGTGASRSREWSTVANRSVRNLLVVGEFSLALVLLTGAGLMVRSFVHVQNVDPGFRSRNLLIARVDLHVGRTEAQQLAYFREAIDRVRSLPGVRSAAVVSDFLHSDPEDSVVVEGHAPQQPGPCDDWIDGAYFETAGIPLKRGRAFSNEDRKDTLPVAIINETMARNYWPGEDPIGKRFRFPSRTVSPWYTVVGVSGDMHRQGLEKATVPQALRPLTQNPDDMMEILVRTSTDPKPIAVVVQNEIQSIDKTVARFHINTVEDLLADQTAERRFQTSLIGLFSVTALVLSGIGIYGLMHYFVAQRTNEIGVRMALGAMHGNVVGMVLKQGLMLAAIGAVLGTLAAFAATQLIGSLLFGVSATDPLTFAFAPAIMLAVAMFACWIPAHRAARIDPLIALRMD